VRNLAACPVAYCGNAARQMSAWGPKPEVPPLNPEQETFGDCSTGSDLIDAV